MRNTGYLLLLLLAATSRPVDAQLDGHDPFPARVLTPGDRLLITVWRMPELSGEFLVASDGSVAHPLFRGIRVVDVPMTTVEDRVRDVLARLQANPQFVVRALLRVAVGGEVSRPSLYNLAPETTIPQAVAEAGGATEQGDLSRVRLLRDGAVSMLDLTGTDLGPLQMPIRSGDQIVVERKRSMFRDYVVPSGSIVAGLASVLALVLRHP